MNIVYVYVCVAYMRACTECDGLVLTPLHAHHLALRQYLYTHFLPAHQPVYCPCGLPVFALRESIET